MVALQLLIPKLNISTCERRRDPPGNNGNEPHTVSFHKSDRRGGGARFPVTVSLFDWHRWLWSLRTISRKEDSPSDGRPSEMDFYVISSETGELQPHGLLIIVGDHFDFCPRNASA